MIFLPSAKFLYRPQTATNIVTPIRAWEANYGVQTVGTDGVTVDAVPVSGNKVKQWTSKVGGIVLSQSVDANRPTYYEPVYGKPYIEMDGRSPTRYLTTGTGSTFFTNLDKMTMAVAMRQTGAYAGYRNDSYISFNPGNQEIPNLLNIGGGTPEFRYGGDGGGLGGTSGAVALNYQPSAETTLFGTFSTVSTSQSVTGASVGKLYANGVVKAVNTATATTRTTTPSAMEVGKAPDGVNSGIKQFYGVYLYDQELTEAQVAASHADISGRLFSWYTLPVTGAALWLDASRSDSLYVESTLATSVTTDNGPVGGWKDLSGNNRHALQGTTGSRPTWRTPINGQNGLGVMSFNGTSQSFAASNTIGWGLVYSGDFTMSFVHKVSSVTGGVLLGQDNGSGAVAKWMFGYGSNGVVGAGNLGFHYNGAGSSFVRVAWTPTAGQTYLITATRSGNDHYFYVDGVQVGLTQTTTSRPANPTVLATISQAENFFWLSGSIAETVVYPTYLNATQLASVKSYLSAKWGTP